MEVFLDDRLIEDTLVGNGTTVEEALCHIQSNLCAPDQMVIRLRCDGQEVSAEAMAETLRKPADSLDRLEIFTGTNDELVTACVTQASACLAETENACRQVRELLKKGKNVEAAKRLSECLRLWQQIHKAVASSIEMLQIDPQHTMVNDEPLIELIGKPKEVLLQVRDALHLRNYVLLADILRYEFGEVTDSFHTIIGRLRREAEDLKMSRPGAPG